MSKPIGQAAILFSETGVNVATGRTVGEQFNVINQTAEPRGATAETTVQALQQRLDLRDHTIVTAVSGEEVL